MYSTLQFITSSFAFMRQVGRCLSALVFCFSPWLLPKPVFAQFTDIGAALAGVSGSVAWGDYDNDDDLDLLLTGQDAGFNPTAKVYRNDGSGVFTDIGAGLTGVLSESVAWGDYDNDGDLDILLTGFTGFGGGNEIAKVYRNDGSGAFTDIGAGLAAVGGGSTAWGDFDNDGDLDFLLTGTSSVSPSGISKVYRNDGSDTFTDIGASLAGVGSGSVAWGDYDNDSDLDILLTGGHPNRGISKVYRNDGGGTFTDIGAGLAAVGGGSTAWGDYDNDGDLDILLIGFMGIVRFFAAVYRNDGGGIFTDIGTDLTAVGPGPVAWGDFDNDGDLDILLNTRSGSATVYRNDGGGTFTDIGAGLTTGFGAGSVAWGDFDNDGDLDIALTTLGAGSSPIAKVYRNDGTVFNTVPAAPINLSQSVSGNSVTFSWNASSDVQTPSPGLTYNLMVGTTSNGIDINSPMANVSTGYRRVVQLGGTNHNESWTLNDLPDGCYFWRVQAVDHTFAGSPFSAEGTFSIGGNFCVKPFVLLADENVEINSQVNSDGDIHANNDIIFNEGNKSQHTGNLTAVDDIIIKKKNKIIGTTAGDEVENEGTITGAITENANLAKVPLPAIADFDAGDDDVEVDEGKTKTLVPGDYGEVKVEKGGKLKLSSGTYNLASLELGEKSVLFIDLTSSLPIVINVDEKLEFGKKATMKLVPSTASTSLITFNLEEDDDVVVIGEGSKVFGSFIAPEATVEIGLKARLKGAVCAENIIVLKGVRFVHHSSTAKFPKEAEVEESEVAKSEVVTDYVLEQNYPNPFSPPERGFAGNPSTEISFQLPVASAVKLVIYSVTGQVVRELVHGEMPAGRHALSWNGRNRAGEIVAGGVYLYRLTVERNGEAPVVMTRKLTVLK